MSANMDTMNANVNAMNAEMNAKMTMMVQMMLQMNQRMNGLPMPAAGALAIGSPMKPLAAIKGSEGATSTSDERTATAESEVLATTADDKSNDEVPNDIESTMNRDVFVNDNGPAMMNDMGQVDIIHGSIKGPQESCVAAGDVTFSF
jgi:N-methylhydantoinase B/oxoprolinase/acetone carboxylase alpha subunit